MEIKKVEEIYIDENEAEIWAKFFKLIENIRHSTTDNDIRNYCYELIEYMHKLSFYIGKESLVEF